MSESLKEKSVNAFVWVFLDKVGGSGLSFIITIILANLLSPNDFGLLAMVMVFIEIANTFIESGFSLALIREKEISETDKSTTFIFNFFASIGIYLLLFFAAPYIARFYNQEILTQAVRIIGLSLVIGSFDIIQKSILSQEINFKTQTIVRLPALIISGIVAILLAYKGYGVWSLAAQLLIKSTINTVLLWVLHPWKPTFHFSKEAFRRLFGFGSNILLAMLLQRFFGEIYRLLIGKFFSSATLGYYTQANNFVNMGINFLSLTVQRVIFPILSKLRDDAQRLREAYRKFVVMSSFVILPAMMLLAVLAKPLIIVLIGAQWLPAVPFLQLLCMVGVATHFHHTNSSMILVFGRSDITLLLSATEKICIVLAVLIGIQYGIFGLVVGQVISSYVNLIVYTYYSNKCVKYTLFEQIRDIRSSIITSLLMGAVVFVFLKYTPTSNLMLLLFGSAIGVITYTGLHWLAKTEEFQLIQAFVVPKTRKLFARFS